MEPMHQGADDRGVGGRAGCRVPTGGRGPVVWTSPCHAFAFVSHHGETAWSAIPVSLLPTLEKIVKRVEGFHVFTSATLGKSCRRSFVGNGNGERKSASESDLAVEDADRIRRADSETLKHIFGLNLHLWLDSCVYDCCFHGFIVTHTQHRSQVVSWRSLPRQYPASRARRPCQFPFAPIPTPTPMGSLCLIAPSWQQVIEPFTSITMKRDDSRPNGRGRQAKAGGVG